MGFRSVCAQFPRVVGKNRPFPWFLAPGNRERSLIGPKGTWGAFGPGSELFRLFVETKYP